MSEPAIDTTSTDKPRTRRGPKPMDLVKWNGMVKRKHLRLLNHVMKANRLNSQSQAMRFILDELTPKHVG